jgi:hypothetical protein
MGILKSKSEGGSGKKRGHSNMDHSGHNAEVKAAAGKRRRLNSKDIVTRELSEITPDDAEMLKAEGRRASRMLKGKIVRVIRRHRTGEVLIEFQDGTRLFVDAKGDEIELSII